jgi:hypothetical protein
MLNKIFPNILNIDNYEKKNNEINRLIKTIGKTIIIYIDDVDRLDSNEILEVFKIIRNTANFCNTIFIVGYDKLYVNNQLKKLLLSNSESYIEKIFQFEYYLPYIKDRFAMRNLIIDKLKSIVSNKLHKDLLSNLYNSKNSTLSYYEAVPHLSKYIVSHRDKIRFLNLFKLNYEKIKDEIYLPDYISICILKLKYPEVHQALYYNKDLLIERIYSIITSNSSKLSIQFKDKITDDLCDTLLYLHLVNNKFKHGLNEIEILNAVELVESIFGKKSLNNTSQERRTLYNHHLTIINPENFERYFDHSISGFLNQFDFDQSLMLSDQELINKIKYWIDVDGFTNDIHSKFENLSEFNDKMLFTKVINAIIYFANLPSSNNINYYNGFNIDNFYNKLGGSNSKEFCDKIFESDIDEYRQCIISFITKINLNYKWNFIHNFVFKIISDNNDNFVLKHEELIKIIFQDFKEKINNEQKLTDGIWHQYINLIRNTSLSKQGELIELSDEGKLITDSIIKLIEKDLKAFLNFNINSTSFDKSEFTIVGWENVIFINDQFINLLDNQKENIAVKEYQEFNNKWVLNNKMAIPFTFIHLKNN